MSFISYAQNYEDVTLYRALKGVTKGVYIDVGANDPVNDSVTCAFYQRGWRGINIEPSPHWHARLQADRPEDINLQIALGDAEGNALLHDIPGTGMGTLVAGIAQAHQARGLSVQTLPVQTRTLSAVCEAHGVGEVHFLKIDVEGAEASVLRGFDLQRWRPWVVVVEATAPNSTNEVHHEWEAILLSQAYHFVYFDGLNRFYVAAEHHSALAHALSKPPNFFDGFIRYSEWHYQQRGDQLEHELVHARGEHAAARDALAVARDQADSERARHALAATELARVHEQVRTLGEALEHRQTECSRLNEALAAERQTNYQLRNEVAALRHELSRTLQSLSWRLTQPLREGKLAVSQVALSALRSPRQSLVRRGGRVLLGSGLAVARAVPAIKPLIARAASLHPQIDAHLRGFARARKAGSLSHMPTPAGTVSHHADPGAAAMPVALPWQAPAVGVEPDRIERALPPGERIVYFFVDHTHRCEVNTGVQRVARGLGRELLARGERVVFVKWDPAAGQLLLLDHAELDALARWSGPVPALADRARYPRQGEPALCVPAHPPQDAHWLLVPEVTHINFHGEPTTLAVLMAARALGLRTGFVFYDAIPLRREELRAVAKVHETYMQQLLLADLLLPISQFVGHDLRAFFRLHEAVGAGSLPMIRPLNLPGESMTGGRVQGPAKGSDKLVLSLGTIEPRKNQLALAEAFEQILQDDPDCGWQLALVGNLHPSIAPRLAAITRRTPAIRWLAHLPDDDVAALYERCAFTAFPSVEEGFGLPILESLWKGKPCLCANFGAMAEVAAGGGCLSTDTRDPLALKEALARLISDAALRERLTSEALTRPIDTWADYAGKVGQALSETTDPRRELGTVYYCIEHTCTFPYNTGIQRVVRGLARGLLDQGVRLIPVRWDFERGAFYQPAQPELDYLARWNGPAADTWTREALPTVFSPRDWLLLPELSAYPGGMNLGAVKAWCAARGVRWATVFYDAIPWKLKELYTPQVHQLHGDYMRALNQGDLALAISEFSRQDLIGFLRAIPDATPDLEQRILACPLPGEFRETARVLDLPARHDGPVRILTVSSVETRKNHIRLLEAFQEAIRQSRLPMELCIAGGCHLPEPQAGAFRALVASIPGVRWEESPDDARLRALYQQCDFTVYPSLEEGFGLPILESLWNARPCLCRDSGAMREVAEGGGCMMVDTADVPAITQALLQLTSDAALRARLAQEAISRPVRTWRDYASDVITRLARERVVPAAPDPLPDARAFSQAMVNLPPRPLLSICITTYNRAGWLALSLRNLARLLPQPVPEVEIVVCDNTSSDNTPEVVKPYLDRPDFRYQRNPRNVGMLGNLRETAHLARGRHVWILGDDDLIMPGSVQAVLAKLRQHPDLALIYLNYAYTREDRAEAVTDLDRFLVEGTPIVAPGPDRLGPVRHISTASENFFTAIYCLVFRRDHAMRAYSQHTDGRPFSSMLTAIPTTHHVLHHMMDEPACWIGQPQLVVNMNVSWMRYAPLWILERLPEVYDRAQRLGAPAAEVDRWREHSVPSVERFWESILDQDPEGNAEYFSPARVVARFKHLPPFAAIVPRLRLCYESAHARGAPAAREDPATVFRAFPIQP